MRKFKGILSTVMIVAVLVVMFTGVLLFFFKGGMIMGVARAHLLSVHGWTAIVFFVCIVLHFILNFKVYISELKKKSKK